MQSHLTRFGLDFAIQVQYAMSLHPTIKTQKDLAVAMGIQESEINEMLTDPEKLTLDSISKMSAALGYKLIITDMHAKHKYGSGA